MEPDPALVLSDLLATVPDPSGDVSHHTQFLEMDASVPGTDASDFSHYVETACKAQPVGMMKAVLLEEHLIFAVKLQMMVSQADNMPLSLGWFRSLFSSASGCLDLQATILVMIVAILDAFRTVNLCSSESVSDLAKRTIESKLRIAIQEQLFRIQTRIIPIPVSLNMSALGCLFDSIVQLIKTKWIRYRQSRPPLTVVCSPLSDCICNSMLYLTCIRLRRHCLSSQ
jgi:hypothetical protein